MRPRVFKIKIVIIIIIICTFAHKSNQNSKGFSLIPSFTCSHHWVPINQIPLEQIVVVRTFHYKYLNTHMSTYVYIIGKFSFRYLNKTSAYPSHLNRTLRRKLTV